MSLNKIKKTVWIPDQQDILDEHRWIIDQLDSIGEEKLNQTIQSAVVIRKRAYMPYSNYAVGAAVLCMSGDIYASINAETVTYTETDHAERSTITKAISEGEIEKSGRKFIQAVVVSHTGESGPCGGCRQRISEHCDNAVLIDVDENGIVQKVTSLKTLFQYAFTPTHLGIE